MAANYVLLDKVTVGSGGASSVTFSSIPQTYTDLVVKVSGRSSASRASNGFLFDIRPNASSANMTRISLYGDGSTATSSSGSDGQNMALDPSDYTSNTFSSTDIYIPNYTSSNFKSISTDTVSENNATQAYAILGSMLWSNTAAIASLQFTPLAGNFVQYSTFYLYGVVNASTAATKKATGGDIITTSGGYTYHAFLTSGTFTPTQSLSCDVLVVAGGGGGGYHAASDKGGGGGGAGGLLAYSSQSLTATGYTVTVGAGGAGGTSGVSQGSNGTNSQFGSLTASVGGGGGGAGVGGSGTGNPFRGLDGGSGGGSTGNGVIGNATSGQGSNGGYGADASAYAGAGGGGKGAVGADSNATGGGAGGAGVNTYSTWLSATTTGVNGFIAGGGGGGSGFVNTANNGAGGSGGGGVGGNNSSAVGGAATINTGSGGGGAGGGVATNQNGGAGGSGIVIVRYAV
jgi:hypothetical protein